MSHTKVHDKVRDAEIYVAPLEYIRITSVIPPGWLPIASSLQQWGKR